MNNNSLIRKLINNKISISVAESCTGGLLASEIEILLFISFLISEKTYK